MFAEHPNGPKSPAERVGLGAEPRETRLSTHTQLGIWVTIMQWKCRHRRRRRRRPSAGLSGSSARRNCDKANLDERCRAFCSVTSVEEVADVTQRGVSHWSGPPSPVVTSAPDCVTSGEAATLIGQTLGVQSRRQFRWERKLCR